MIYARLIFCAALLLCGVSDALWAVDEPARLNGLYSKVPIQWTAARARHLKNKLKSNPFLSGITISVHWNDIETREGEYNLAGVDRTVEAARRAKKQYGLIVTPGFYTPEYVYLAGAQKFNTVVTNKHRANYGQQVSIPLPWDEIYQSHFSRLIQTLGERYGSDPACVSVAITCASYMSAEMHLPRRPEDIRNWKSVGLTGDRLLEVYEKYIDQWAVAFPTQAICLHASSLSFIKDMNHDDFIDRLIDYGHDFYPQRFALQTCNLNGRKEAGAGPERWVMRHKDCLINGFQSLASFKATPQRQGDLEMTVLNYMRADSQYWQLWQADGLDVETCASIQAALDEAFRVGYDAHRQKVIPDL